MIVPDPPAVASTLANLATNADAEYGAELAARTAAAATDLTTRKNQFAADALAYLNLTIAPGDMVLDPAKGLVAPFNTTWWLSDLREDGFDVFDGNYLQGTIATLHELGGLLP